MKRILRFTNDLSKALQRKDQDIGNAIGLVKLCKERLQSMRNNEWEWDKFLKTVCSFYVEHKIDIPNMDEMFTPLGRSRRATVKNMHHYRVDLFNDVIDLQESELNDRFSEAHSDLLFSIACLCPNNSFSSFNIDKVIKLSKYYPREFSPADVLIMEEQLEMYILDMRTNEDFMDLVGLSNLAEKLFLRGNHDIYPLLYKLLTLALILPVATASVERAFSAMAYVKNRLRNRIGDQWLNDSLVVYIEKDVFDTLSEDVILERYQNMKH